MFTSFSSIRELEFGMKTNLMDFTKKKGSDGEGKKNQMAFI
jgi:hypothetical protein